MGAKLMPEQVDFIGDQLVICKLYVADSMLARVRVAIRGIHRVMPADESGDQYVWLTDPLDVVTAAAMIAADWGRPKQKPLPQEWVDAYEHPECFHCGRPMSPDEVGDELPQERYCDSCAEKLEDEDI